MFSITILSYTFIIPISQLQIQQLMTSQIRSHVEYLMQTYNTLVFIFYSKFVKPSSLTNSFLIRFLNNFHTAAYIPFSSPSRPILINDCRRRACDDAPLDPNSTWLVTSPHDSTRSTCRASRHDTTQHVQRVKPMHFGCVESVEHTRHTRHVELDRRDPQLCCVICTKLWYVSYSLIYWSIHLFFHFIWRNK